MVRKWPHWSGNSRRSAVESLVALTPHLVIPRAATEPDEFRVWLRRVGFLPKGTWGEDEPAVRWLERWSLPLDQIAAADLEQALTAATTKRDGDTELRRGYTTPPDNTEDGVELGRASW